MIKNLRLVSLFLMGSTAAISLMALSTHAGITKAVGKNIFPIATKSEVKFPFIVYEKENVTTLYDKMGVAAVNMDYSIYVLAESYTESEQIAEMVVNCLNRRKAQYDGYEVINATVTDVPEDYNSRIR